MSASASGTGTTPRFDGAPGPDNVFGPKVVPTPVPASFANGAAPTSSDAPGPSVNPGTVAASEGTLAQTPEPPAGRGPTPPWHTEDTSTSEWRERRTHSPYTAQTRILRRTIILRALATALLFSLAYGALAWCVNAAIVPQLAEEVADTTAPWTYLSADEYADYTDNLQGIPPENIDIVVNWDHLNAAEAKGEGAAAEDAQGTSANEASGATDAASDGADGLDLGGWDYAVRDLSTYNALRACKLPLAIGLYLAGLLVILVVALNRSLRYFNKLSTSVAALFANREAPIELPDELSIIRGELADIRAKALADNRAAAHAEQRKNELVAYLAHDIKTPLTSVMGYLTLLKEAPDLPQETRSAYAGIALDKAERLEGLVDEFFEITRYNLQSIPIERQTIDLTLLCRQVADEFYPEARARSLTIETDAPESTPIFADPDKIGRALSNIVRNALAYADAATTVRIVVSLEGDVACVRVIDRGREISPAHLQRIFEKFFREDTSRSTTQGGTGLGLAIAREIVQAHGGNIAATSDNGLTTFTVTLPRSAR